MFEKTHLNPLHFFSLIYAHYRHRLHRHGLGKRVPRTAEVTVKPNREKSLAPILAYI